MLRAYALALLGALCLVYGLWLAYAPLGFIVAGLLVVAVAIVWDVDVKKKSGR